MSENEIDHNIITGARFNEATGMHELRLTAKYKSAWFRLSVILDYWVNHLVSNLDLSIKKRVQLYASFEKYKNVMTNLINTGTRLVGDPSAGAFRKDMDIDTSLLWSMSCVMAADGLGHLCDTLMTEPEVVEPPLVTSESVVKEEEE
jgi:hypothetical protein